MNTIKINGKEYRVKGTIRAMFIFEKITNKSFAIETMLDNYIYFYSLLLANNENILDWDEFINALDDDPNIYIQLNNILTQNSKINDLLNPIDDDSESEVKKN